MIYFHPNFDSVRVFRDAGRYLCQVSSADTSLDTYLTAACSITFATYRNLNLMSTVCAYQQCKPNTSMIHICSLLANIFPNQPVGTTAVTRDNHWSVYYVPHAPQ